MVLPAAALIIRSMLCARLVSFWSAALVVWFLTCRTGPYAPFVEDILRGGRNLAVKREGTMYAVRFQLRGQELTTVKVRGGEQQKIALYRDDAP